MRSITKVFICAGLLFILIPFICFAQEQDSLPQELTATPEHKSGLFQGEINANNIRIRSDSTVSSAIICIANNGEPVEVVKELYGWYRVRLPKTAPSFIKKNLVTVIDEKTAKVIKDNVNIRLKANESSPIVGKADKNEVINTLEEKGEWYKIEPPNNSFGWVNKKFVNKASGTIIKREEVELAQKMEPTRAISLGGSYGPQRLDTPRSTKKENKIADEKASQDENAAIEGIIKPYGKVIKRIATHKLITADNNVLLLKGNKGSLDSLNYHKVMVTGKLIHPKNPKHSIIEILKIEALD